jgi:cation diffusion facilitator family transporter
LVDPKQYKSSVALLSVASNAFLVIVKLVIGLFIGSISVISEAIHSGVDLVAALIALFSVRKSAKPADYHHPYGHGKVENISGTIEAILIFFAAGLIINEAFHKLLNPQPLGLVGWGVGVMLLSSVINIVVSHLLFVVGRATDSVALEADAWHLRTDVYTSAGVLFGLLVILVGKWAAPNLNLNWIDPAAAIAVALLIIFTAYRMVRKSARDILDASLPDHELSQIRELIFKQTPDVVGFHGLRTRKAGSTRFVEFHLLVDQDMTVFESHRITQVITDDIRQLFPETYANIHIEPCDKTCPPECTKQCILTDWERNARSPRNYLAAIPKEKER